MDSTAARPIWHLQATQAAAQTQSLQQRSAPGSFNRSQVLYRLIYEQGLDESHAAWVTRRLSAEWRKGFDATLLGACLSPLNTGLDILSRSESLARRPQLGVTTGLKHQKLAVGLFDDRSNPNVEAMLQLFDAIRRVSDANALVFHALLRESMSLPGVHVTALDSIPEHARCVQRGLARFVSEHGKSMSGVLHKVMLHWILPADVGRLILLDTDLVPLRDLATLKDEFGTMRRRGALFGVAAEQSLFYSSGQNMPHGVPGYNTGVWLMDLVAMRKSSWYAWLLDAYQAGALFRKLGMVPDQNLINGVASLTPALVHTISCGWNRQMMAWTLSSGGHVLHANNFPSDATNRTLICHEPCSILHFNGNHKCPVRLLNAAADTCTAWHSMIRDIPSTPDDDVRNRTKCVLRKQFGGLHADATARVKVAEAAWLYWGDCCR